MILKQILLTGILGIEQGISGIKSRDNDAVIAVDIFQAVLEKACIQ